MKELIEKLKKEIVYHQEELSKRHEIVDKLRDICNHEDCSDDGRDSHHYYTRCNICGKRFAD